MGTREYVRKCSTIWTGTVTVNLGILFFLTLQHRQARGKPHPLCSARGQRYMWQIRSNQSHMTNLQCCPMIIWQTFEPFARVFFFFEAHWFLDNATENFIFTNSLGFPALIFTFVLPGPYDSLPKAGDTVWEENSALCDFLLNIDIHCRQSVLFCLRCASVVLHRLI